MTTHGMSMGMDVCVSVGDAADGFAECRLHGLQCELHLKPFRTAHLVHMRAQLGITKHAGVRDI